MQQKFTCNTTCIFSPVARSYSTAPEKWRSGVAMRQCLLPTDVAFSSVCGNASFDNDARHRDDQADYITRKTGLRVFWKKNFSKKNFEFLWIVFGILWVFLIVANRSLWKGYVLFFKYLYKKTIFGVNQIALIDHLWNID